MISAMPCSPNAAFVAANVSSLTRFVSSSSEQKRCSAASFGLHRLRPLAGRDRRNDRRDRGPPTARPPCARSTRSATSNGAPAIRIAISRSGARQRGVEAHLRAELLREVAHERRAQHDVERPAHRRSRAVEDVAHHRFLRLRHLRPLQRRKPIADELEIRRSRPGGSGRGAGAVLCAARSAPPRAKNPGRRAT